MVSVAEHVAEGDLDVDIDVTSEDEVGQLLKAIQNMVTYIQCVANVAERISEKDLHVTVTPKSDRDVLNHSLVKMVTNLHKMIDDNGQAMTEIEQQNQAMKQQSWIKDGIGQLSAELSGENSLRAVCQKAITFTARYINAGQGVLYVYEPEREIVKLYGFFAFTERDDISNEYAVGEGVIGQVAFEREPILLKHPTEKESLITTGTFSGVPVNTYTFPLVYEEELYGVLELASFEPFETVQQEFLTEANRVIATALFSTAQRERVQELLRQSQEAATAAEQAKAEAQQQAEDARRMNVLLEEKQQELEQQSEELRQMNVQLKEREQELQQQQEELRQQNEALKQI
jgi:GAF domain-containing protein